MVSYRVKIRRSTTVPLTYMWGGDGIQANSRVALVLSFRVEEEGEPIEFGIRKIGGGNPNSVLGSLQPGETFSLHLDGIAGVFASCEFDAYVACTILTKPIAH